MRDVAFLGAFMLYAWAGIDPRLIYHWQAPVFTTIPGFFGEFARYPGGAADYLQCLLAQAYAGQWCGALVLGAGVYGDGEPTSILEGRLRTAHELSRTGKVRWLRR